MTNLDRELAVAYRRLGYLDRERQVLRCCGACRDPWCPRCKKRRNREWWRKRTAKDLEGAIYVELSTMYPFDQDEWTVKEAVGEAQEWVKATFPDLREWHRSVILSEEEGFVELVLPFWLAASMQLLAPAPPNALWQLAVRPTRTAFDREYLADRMTVRMEGNLDWGHLRTAIPRVEEVPRAVGWVSSSPTSAL